MIPWHHNIGDFVLPFLFVSYHNDLFQYLSVLENDTGFCISRLPVPAIDDKNTTFLQMLFRFSCIEARGPFLLFIMALPILVSCWEQEQTIGVIHSTFSLHSLHTRDTFTLSMACFTEFVLRACFLGRWDKTSYLHFLLVIITSTSWLENKTATQLIRDTITAISNNKQPDRQSIFEYINKVSANNTDENYIVTVIEVMLNKNLIYNKTSKR